MKAVVNGHVIADSDDVVDCGGYQYFPTPRSARSASSRHRQPIRIWPARMASNSMTW